MEQPGIRRHGVVASDSGAGPSNVVGVDACAPARQSVSLFAREVTLDKRHVEQSLLAFDDDNSASANYEQLAVALAVGAEHQPLKRILIASAMSGDGRTSVVLNLAAALAQANKRVLVIDCDLRNPCVLRALGMHASVGLVEVVTDETPLVGSVTKIWPPGYDVLPTCGPVDNPICILSSPSFREILATLDHFYDFILFDSAPLVDASSHFLVHLTDTVLLVIRAGVTTTAQLSKAIEPLKEENLFGVVLNRAS